MTARVVLVALVGAACAAGPLPRITHTDTRPLVGIQTDTAVSRRAIEAYREADSAGLEQALCLYGSIRGTPGKWMLVITRAAPPMESQRMPMFMIYRCDRHATGYVGRWHTHLAVSGSVEANPMPSPIDEADFWSDSRSLVMLVGFRLLAREADTVLLATWEFQDRRRGLLVMAGR